MAADLQAIAGPKKSVGDVVLLPLGQEKMSPEEAEMAEAEELLRAAEEKGGRPWGVTGQGLEQARQPGSFEWGVSSRFGKPTSSKSLVFFERDHGGPRGVFWFNVSS